MYMLNMRQMSQMGVSLLSLGASACSASAPAPMARAEQGLEGADAGAVVDAGSVDGVARYQRFGDALAHWPLFVAAEEAWRAQLLSSAGTPGGAAPYPPFQSPLQRPDVALEDIYGGYVSALVGAYGFSLLSVDYLPFGPVPSTISVTPGDEAALRGGGALILAADDPEQLYAMTDFSGGGARARIAQACMMYLAQPYRDRRGLAADDACRALGEVVPYAEVQSVLVDDARLLSARDCGLPSAIFGEYSPGTRGRWHYAWPDYSQRDERYAEPCVASFLKLRVTRVGGAVSEGWVPEKAVADYTRFEFPHSWSDPENSALPDRRGVNRPAYLSTRLSFQDGVGLYLGNSPLWVVTLEQLIGMLTDTSGSALARFLVGPTAGCDDTDPAASAPCRLGRQQPFTFPNLDLGLWVIDALDSGHADYDATDLGGNPVEFGGTYPSDSFMTAWDDTIAFFKYRASSTRDWRGAAEQLGAMWHSLSNHNKNAERYRMAIVPLDPAQQTLLLVPDQGYFQLGAPTADFAARLLAVRWGEALVPEPIAPHVPFAIKSITTN